MGQTCALTVLLRYGLDTKVNIMASERCTYSLDGEHHYGPRKWLRRDANGKSADPNAPGAWEHVIACRCNKRPDNEAEVRAGLAATARERARQVELSRKQARELQQGSWSSPEAQAYLTSQPKLPL